MPDRKCPICDTLSLSDLTELDLFMGDASRWPPTIWDPFTKPVGQLTARRQWFGGMKAGQMWLNQHGYVGRFTNEAVRSHYRWDVTVIAADPIELMNKGIIARGNTRTADLPADGEKIDPQAYLRYFNRGIALGNRGLELLATRVEELMSRNEEVPTALLMKIADIGGKLATTQAALLQRGLRMGEADDADEGFRAGSVEGGLPSPRIGHARVRVIDGTARPVADEGQADREHFSERSRSEGGGGLPH
jgi:hypothetical protein